APAGYGPPPGPPPTGPPPQPGQQQPPQWQGQQQAPQWQGQQMSRQPATAPYPPGGEVYPPAPHPPPGPGHYPGPGHPAAGPAGAAPAPPPRPGGGDPGRPQMSVAALTPQALLRQRRRPPQSGWRKAVYLVSAHSVNPGESPADVRRRQLIERATVPVHGCYRIAVISLKGGVGKTTAGVCLGATLASLRGDRVIAVDANPDRGTLSGKIPLQTPATVRNLLNDANQITRYSDVRRYTS